MGFASAYLEKRGPVKALVNEKPLHDTGIIVTVPCFDEPAIKGLLDSLLKCENPGCSVEVLVGINAPPSASENQERQNRDTINEINSWKDANKDAPFRLFFYDGGRSMESDWGAGLARRVIMDEALRRFNIIDNPDGIIVSLDADCTVSSNYLATIQNRFSAEPGASGASIRFEHYIPGKDENPRLRNSIIEYELHLRYYYQSLKYSGYPHVYHTVGSAMATRADAYAKVGGMNRRQAGEDFYFIQKLVQLGGFIEINEAVVYPSPRVSDRVPFGTGAAMKAIMDNPDQPYLTYNPQAFIDLRSLVEIVPSLYEASGSALVAAKGPLPEPINLFLNENKWLSRVDEARSNTAGKDSFVKRFYSWFNMFQVVKYLNFVHSGNFYRKIAVDEASGMMIRLVTGDYVKAGRYELLEQYRKLEI